EEFEVGPKLGELFSLAERLEGLEDARVGADQGIRRVLLIALRPLDNRLVQEHGVVPLAEHATEPPVCNVSGFRVAGSRGVPEALILVDVVEGFLEADHGWT